MIPKRLNRGDIIGIVSPSKNLDHGHKCPNTPLPIGGTGKMDAEKLSFKIIEPCVQ